MTKFIKKKLSLMAEKSVGYSSVQISLRPPWVISNKNGQAVVKSLLGRVSYRITDTFPSVYFDLLCFATEGRHEHNKNPSPLLVILHQSVPLMIALTSSSSHFIFLFCFFCFNSVFNFWQVIVYIGIHFNNGYIFQDTQFSCLMFFIVLEHWIFGPLLTFID